MAGIRARQWGWGCLVTPGMFGFFQKFKKGLARTARGLLSFLGNKTLDEETLLGLEEALYGADFGVETTEEVMEAIRKAYKTNKELRGQEAAEIGSTVLKDILKGAQVDWALEEHKPEVICLVGVNGAGKTTTAAKLAYQLAKKGKKVLLGACDTFRAAANEQIKTWAEKLDIDIVASHHGADSAAVAFDAYQAAKSRECDILILDTAGRLHTKIHLMEELKKLHRVLGKHDEKAPHHIWLVVDGSLGSNSIAQAKVFHEALNLTGLIITKLDGTSRGGALVGIYRELKLPILYVGLGEAPDDLELFDVEKYVKGVFEGTME